MRDVTVQALESCCEHEASVVLSDGSHTCTVLCSPPFPVVGDRITVALTALDSGNVELSKERSERIVAQRGAGELSHWLVGRVLASSRGAIQIGGFVIEGIHLPGDAAVGELVQVGVERLDVLGWSRQDGAS